MSQIRSENTLWSKLSGHQLKEAIEIFRVEKDSENDHLSFDEYQLAVDVVALAEWIEWEYSEILMLRESHESIMKAEAEDFDEYIRNGGQ